MPKFDPGTNITLSNSTPMADDVTLGVTSHAALWSDNIILAVANSKTAVHFWDAGTWQNSSPVTGDIVVLTDTMTVASGGNGVFNITSDHTSTGTAICSVILINSCVANFVDSTGVFSQGLPTITSNKVVTIATTKQVQSGVVIATITVVGTVTQPASPNGTTVRFFGIGIAA